MVYNLIMNTKTQSYQLVYQILLWASLFLSSCNVHIAKYDQNAYEQATALKVDSLSLMDKATQPASEQADEIEELLLKIEKAYEYAKGRPRNEISVQLWEILKDPDKNLLGGFIKRWQEKNTLSPFFIQEAKNLIARAYDHIIGLESGKLKPAEVKVGE